MTEKLTPQQESLFIKYLEKWRKVAFSTEPINREKSESAIKKAYTLIDEPEPQVFFFDSPYAAVVALDKLEDEIGCSELDYDDMIDRLWDKLVESLTPTPLLKDKDDYQLRLQTFDVHKIIRKDVNERYHQPDEPFYWIPEEFKEGTYQPDTVCSEMARLDFSVSELKCDEDSEIWQNFQAIVNNCGWIASYQELCVVCDRPCILTFDEQHKLHGEDKPAIQFVDGYSVYASHGERISKFE
ncbi:MAG: DUF6745 domain-containing protein [Cyanobacteria bacterium J06621_15]